MQRREAVPLLHVLAHHALRSEGIRCLAIKGPVLELQGLREARPSVDADVWVDPCRWADALAHLDSIGWQEGSHNISARVVPPHSATLTHDQWPIELDLHHRFPGFLADPQHVFDVLHARRSQVRIAGVLVDSTDVVGSAAVAALHLLRDPNQRRAEIAGLIDRLRSRLDSQHLKALAELATDSGSASTLAPVLEALNVTSGALTNQEAALEAWRLRAASSGMHSVAWLYQLRSSPLSAWPGILRRAVLLTEPDIRRLYPDERADRWGLLRGRLRRLIRGLWALPSAYKLVRDVRRDPKHVQTDNKP